MKERPILYSTPMVVALLREVDPKTQTRRGITRLTGFGQITEFGPSDTPGYDWHFRDRAMRWHDISHARLLECCPYGQTGDRLWVRENGWERPYLSQRDLREGADTWPPYEYDAEPLMCWAEGELKGYGWKRRPSIHMPRWASRIDLEITGVRVERLQDISEADAIAEGIQRPEDMSRESIEAMDVWAEGAERSAFNALNQPVAQYRRLWEQINGSGSWAANPWVWCVEFRRIRP